MSAYHSSSANPKRSHKYAKKIKKKLTGKGLAVPVGKHYQGHGDEVMASMQKTYDPETAKRVFYATENKQKNKAKRKKAKKRSGKR